MSNETFVGVTTIGQKFTELFGVPMYPPGASDRQKAFADMNVYRGVGQDCLADMLRFRDLCDRTDSHPAVRNKLMEALLAQLEIHFFG